MKTQFENAARDVSQSVNSEVGAVNKAFETEWSGVTQGLDDHLPLAPPPPSYQHPKKNWRLKRGAMPQWYKQRNGVRGKAQSGAARVARFRPPAR